jgi:predicted RecB family endonuclease
VFGKSVFIAKDKEGRMPQKDLFHENAKTALIKDGWEITDDPLHLAFGDRDLYIDLAGEKSIGAEKDGQRIAVEIKTFRDESDINNLKEAVGQHQIYRSVLQRSDKSALELYLAITEEVYSGIFSEPLGEIILLDCKINLIVFDELKEEITQWVQNP